MYSGTDDFDRVYQNILEIYRRTGIEAVVKEDLEDAIDHGVLVTKTVRLLCDALGLADEFKEQVLTAAGLHDIGKLQLGQFLYGRDKNAMHVDEMHYMRMHAENSKNLLEICEYPDAIVQAVYHHHENYDGSGYPGNLVGTKIPLSARILKVCDTFCALVSERPYRKAFEFDTALEMMIEDSKDLDMGIFLEFMKLFHSEEFEEIKEYAAFANAKKHYLHGA
ncbi:MAG: HD domain-containing protein [Lachnospiraceae bacterium]|nr:HD domain-containing protein [Lachnospiraceae bacterium]